MERNAVARLIGAPPGYVGYEEGGQLTEAVRRRPYAVLLLDEVEKAHPDVFNLLLQVLDDGRLTDSQGRTVDFRHTVVVMTSNLASPAILDHARQQDADDSALQRKVDEALASHFRPEFLNRIDEVIRFRPLQVSDLVKIVTLQLQELTSLLAEQGLSLAVEDGVAGVVDGQNFSFGTLDVCVAGGFVGGGDTIAACVGGVSADACDPSSSRATCATAVATCAPSTSNTTNAF